MKQKLQKGISGSGEAAQRKPDNAEYHRILGTLCGQVIPATCSPD